MTGFLFGLMLGIAVAPPYPPAWLRVAALVVALALVFGGCSAEPTAVGPAPAADPWADYGEPAAPQLWAAVVDRWHAHGFPSASLCELPREVTADLILFEELCGRGSGGATACQRPGLIVIADGMSTDLTRTRAHEMLHVLAECTGAASAAENRAHALPGVWYGEHTVLSSFSDPDL